MVGVHNHVHAVVLHVVRKVLLTVWEAIRVQRDPLCGLGIMADANIKSCLIVPEEVFLILEHGKPKLSHGIACVHVDKPTTYIAEEVG